MGVVFRQSGHLRRGASLQPGRLWYGQKSRILLGEAGK